MDKISWKSEYSSGLNYLDSHRRNYIEIVNELIDICNSKDHTDRFPIVFHRLAFFIEDYFAKKEMAIREAPHIPFIDYKKEHQRFTAGIARFQERYRLGETDICFEMVNYMMDWFLNYINRFGSEAPDFMRSRGFE